jgi:hypothetical protein
MQAYPSLFAILRVDVLLEMASAVFSLIISLLALDASRRIGSRTLLQLGAGFLLMAIAMLSRSLSVAGLLSSTFAGEIPRLTFLTQLFLLEIIYSVIRIAGYIIFIYLYASTMGSAEKKATEAFPAIAIYNPVFELASAILLTFVVYRTAVNWMHAKRPFSWVVFLGFTLLMSSHILFLLTNQSFTYYLAGHFTQLASLALFLLAVILVRLDEKGV